MQAVLHLPCSRASAPAAVHRGAAAAGAQDQEVDLHVGLPELHGDDDDDDDYHEYDDDDDDLHQAPHKSSYSYSAAVLLSTWLWRSLFEVSVIVTLIYDEEKDLERLRDLERALLSLTAHVLVLVTVIRSSDLFNKFFTGK